MADQFAGSLSKGCGMNFRTALALALMVAGSGAPAQEKTPNSRCHTQPYA